MALEGIRGNITREHSDIDILLMKSDLLKFCKLMKLEKYSCIKREKMYFFELNNIKIGVVILTKEKNIFIANGNKTLEIYPEKIFDEDQWGEIKGINFRIAPYEVLVFESQYSKYEEDKKFAAKLSYDKTLFKHIKFRKIRDSCEKINFK